MNRYPSVGFLALPPLLLNDVKWGDKGLTGLGERFRANEWFGPERVKTIALISAICREPPSHNCSLRRMTCCIRTAVHRERRAMALEEYRPPTKVKLAALWASTMFCYAYGDYFGLYVPGTLADMSRGNMGPLGQASSGVLIGVSLMMAVPSLMVALSLLLPAAVSRWASVILGTAYTGIMAVSLPGSEPFYKTLGVIEITLTMAIAIVALRWPHTLKHDGQVP